MKTCLFVPYPDADGLWNSDPVHKHADGFWWWYDENWLDENGPYQTETAARAALEDYARKVLGYS